MRGLTTGKCHDKEKIDAQIGQKFAVAAAMLMIRVFSKPLDPNPRRCAFAAGPASAGKPIARPDPDSKFNVVGLGFIPGREWKGPVEIFVEELRKGERKRWDNCSFWADEPGGPFFLLTDDPDVCFSFDGHALVPLVGEPDERAAGIKRAHTPLREAALRLPLEEIERHRMM